MVEEKNAAAEEEISEWKIKKQRAGAPNIFERLFKMTIILHTEIYPKPFFALCFGL